LGCHPYGAKEDRVFIVVPGPESLTFSSVAPLFVMADTIRSKPTPFLVLYVVYVLILTLHPFAFSGSSSIPLTRFLGEFLTARHFAIQAAATKDFAVNVLLFIPFGALLYCCVKSPEKSGGVILFVALIAGGALSLLIEVAQLFLGRHSSVSDVIANAAGSACGALIFFPLRVRTGFGRLFDNIKASKVFLVCILVYGSAPLVLSILQSPWPNFRTWNSSFPFQMANEATLDRPWLGRIYFVAVYNRALSPAEIGNNFRSGFSANATGNRAKVGLVALYTFAEGGGEIVHDVSGFGDPLNLLIAPATHVNWLIGSNGVEVVQPAIIKSRGPASKLGQAFGGSDEISIEAWFTPANLTQSGPARIVSYSEGLSRHNFTLGQHGSDVMFWLRTLISGLVGGAGLQTNDDVLTLDVSHVVATYRQGIERLYVNGYEHPNELDVTKDLIIAFGAPKRVLAQIGYAFFYFFPVSLFVAAFLSTRNRAFIGTFVTAVVVAMGLMAVTEIVQSVFFDRSIDLILIGYGLIIAIFGSLAGAGLPINRVPATNEISSLFGR
jgi:VanZ family protein